MVNRDFLKAVLADKKKLMALKDVKWVQVPKFEELSVDNIMNLMKDDEAFKSYFPDKLPKGRNPGREYTWNILNSLYEPYVLKLISHANRQRYTAENEERKNETIEISDDWMEKLLRNPFVSCKFLCITYCNRM